MRTLTLSLTLLSACFVFGQPSKRYKPIVLDPAYEHTKYTTEPSDMIYEFAAFTSSFDGNDDGEAWGVPEWVSYEIKGTPNQTKSGKRPSKWLTDPGNKDVVPTDATYAVSGTRSLKEVKSNQRYVRGHLCMKKIAGRVSLDAEYNTHTTLNAVPQLQWQNAGIWLNLEDKTVDWAEKYGRVWVVTGPVFFNQAPAVWLGQKGEVPAAVPDALYKVVIIEVNNEPQALAFLIPNVIDPDNKDFSDYLTSVNRVEELTGLDFMANANDEAMENQNKESSDKAAVVSAW